MDFTNDELVFLIQALTYTHPKSQHEIDMRNTLLDAMDDKLKEQRM
jgi:hypothetical protein